MKVIYALKESEIIGHDFCVCLVETLGAMLAPQRSMHLVILFSEIMNQRYCVPEMSLS